MSHFRTGGFDRRRSRSIAIGALLMTAAAIPSPRTPPAGALTLEDAVTRALARNERAAIASEQARAAEARVQRARSFLLPDLTVLADYTRRGSESDTPFFDGSDDRGAEIRLGQTLFDARGWFLLRQARRARDAARWGVSDARRDLAFETAGAFLATLNTEQVARAALERLDLARRNSEEIRARYDAQLVSSNDVTRAQLEMASAEREAVTARGVARTARVALGHLLDTDIEDSLAVPAVLLASAAAPLERVPIDPALAADRRPDVQAERARVASLRAFALEPLARYVPRVDVTGSVLRAGAPDPDRRDDAWRLGLALTWDLFDGGAREAERAERSALARAAALELKELERRVGRDVATARVALESQQASLARSEVAVDAARRNAAETAELYRRGLARALEVVDANVQLFEAEVERSGAQFALALALLDLRSALGLAPIEGGVEP